MYKEREDCGLVTKPKCTIRKAIRAEDSVNMTVREGCKKSKWKFKMAFAIRGPTPPPLNGKISRHFFTPLFFFCN